MLGDGWPLGVRGAATVEAALVVGDVDRVLFASYALVEVTTALVLLVIVVGKILLLLAVGACVSLGGEVCRRMALLLLVALMVAGLHLIGDWVARRSVVVAVLAAWSDLVRITAVDDFVVVDLH